MTAPGDGTTTGHANVQEDGSLRLPVMGRDRLSGRWASFDVVLSWHQWNVLNEYAYNDREEVAQSRIC